MRDILMYYIFLINIISVILYTSDKMFAKIKVRRISEKTLLLSSVIGGAFGGLISMYIFRHKTSEIKFKITNFGMSIIWIIVLIYIYFLI